MDSIATFPVKRIKSAHEMACPYFCLMGQRMYRLDIDILME